MFSKGELMVQVRYWDVQMSFVRGQIKIKMLSILKRIYRGIKFSHELDRELYSTVK